MLESYAVPCPEFEYRFHPVRQWRFDLAWPRVRVGLEIQGGVFGGGRHTRGAALLQEYEKLNAAAALGWRVLFFTPAQLRQSETYGVLRSTLQATAE